MEWFLGQPKATRTRLIFKGKFRGTEAVRLSRGYSVGCRGGMRVSLSGCRARLKGTIE